MSRDILVFDFISHANMHLMFNEGYVQVLRAAYPSDVIHFYATEGHCHSMRALVSEMGDINIDIVPGYELPKARFYMDVFNERRNAKPCFKIVKAALKGKDVRFVSLLGADAALHAQFRKKWHNTTSCQLHIILHGQLGASFVWRSRNPLMRIQDMQAQFARKQPVNIKFMVLEPGAATAIVKRFPSVAPNILTLEHPILPEEWSSDDLGSSLKLGFLGSIRTGKGFEAFCHAANEVCRQDIEFDVVGHLSQPELISGKKLPFNVNGEQLSRSDYLKKLRELSYVCIFLEDKAYDYTASGTLADAVTALKPIIAIRNMVLSEIFEKYGPIGYLFDDMADVVTFLRDTDHDTLVDSRREWQHNLKVMREARSPKNLALDFERITN